LVFGVFFVLKLGGYQKRVGKSIPSSSQFQKPKSESLRERRESERKDNCHRSRRMGGEDL
jgi:hypothetical protein